MRRDEFRSPVKNALRERVAYRCSNPDCRVPTAGPGDSPETVTRVGDAAHITAAAPEGPRYDENLTTEQRRSIDNGIWLCKPCAQKIDSQHKSHPVSLLRRWKAAAEETAAREMGRPIPDGNSVQKEFVSALTGTPSLSTTLIHNAHTATGTALENLDKRFTVTTSYIDGRTEFLLNANEKVELSIKIRNTDDNNYKKQFDDLFSHGDSISIPTDAIDITGSPLVEHALKKQGNSGTGSLVFQPPKHSAILKLSVISPDKTTSHQFDDVRGDLTVGYKKMKFQGSTFEDAMSIQITTTTDDLAQGNATIGFDITKWNGLAVEIIPNLEDIYLLLDLVSKGWEIDVQLKHQGTYLYKGRLNSEHFLFKATTTIISYTHRAKKLSAALNTPIYFQITTITPEDHKIFNEYTKIGFPGTYNNPGNLKINSSVILIADKNSSNLKHIKSISHPISIRYSDAQNWEFPVFGIPMIFPKRTLILNGVTPHIEADIDSIKEGDEVKVKFIPENNFSWSIEYENTSQILANGEI